MFSCLLKRVLPFTLTFTVGATLGWLFHFQGSGARFVEMTTRLESRVAPFGYGYGHSCRMRSRYLVAETKPLVILFKPDARLPYRGEMGKEGNNFVSVTVTFGADGKVHEVEQLPPLMPDEMKQAVERAARQIQFTPETINGIPVSVTKEILIRFMPN
jgi:hypothetical protein